MTDTVATEERTKLRLVLDYMPCEPCLSLKVADQELYCSLCKRLNRTVAEKSTVHLDVLVETPLKEEPVPVIVPAPPEAEEPAGPIAIPITILPEEPVPEPLAAAPLEESALTPEVPVEATLEGLPEPEFPEGAPIPLEEEEVTTPEPEPVPEPYLTPLEESPEPDVDLLAAEEAPAPTEDELSAYTAEAATAPTLEEPAPPAPVEAEEEEFGDDDLFGVSVSAVDEDDLFDYAPKAKKAPEAPAHPASRRVNADDLSALDLDLGVVSEQEAARNRGSEAPAAAGFDETDFVIAPEALENRDTADDGEDAFLLEGFDTLGPMPEEDAAVFEEDASRIEAFPEPENFGDFELQTVEEPEWPKEEAPSTFEEWSEEGAQAPAAEAEAFEEVWEEAPVDPGTWQPEAETFEEVAPEPVQDLAWDEPAPAAEAEAETFEEVWEEAPVEPAAALAPEAVPEPAPTPVVEESWDAPVEDVAWPEETPAETVPEPLAAEPAVAVEEQPVAPAPIAQAAAPAPAPTPAADEWPAEETARESGDTNVKLLEGVGPANRRKLRDIGVQNLAQLLARDPEDIAQKTGIPLKQALRWQQVAELTVQARIPLEYSEVLVSAGVLGVEGLRALPAEEITVRLAASSQRPVTRGMVASWKGRV